MKGARWLVDSLRAKQPFNKDLGQHFLVNDELIDFAVKHSSVSEEDHVLEIGPGPGVLTEVLLESHSKVTAIELDEGAVKHLTEMFAPEIVDGKLIVISGDALQIKWPKDITKVVSNIPYQISSPLIERLTKHLREQEESILASVLLLVQEEFGERLVMEYDSDVGSLGMTALLDWESEIVKKVAPHNFSPNPKVHSCFVEMTPSGEIFDCDKRLVKQVIHATFAQRRKKLRSTLKSAPKRISRIPEWHSGRWKKAFASLTQDERLDSRPEELDFDDWVELCCDLTENSLD
ncbi:MAG: ribosomal RNA small subunit methyltransferase A [Euryarchaeota archaeon]|jgi:16S rRNA (adenine1518-N6/adenine1519-N6)-dimethyltransferase|nr:ribosomal RNA small subunit methyltransferase A [Euryarchaeota archaeon]MBT4925070.1 ribosomal RNA small subunit methyltransferase A [Euryarchaeota archaeon]MBT5735274.1 ribosomal RNA small subunit methyltransferase A [Euryarchaeota archaeon]MBT7460749.1 ribosomal RNA small subunit methyltransferase A [Euryarchaeota archaeon]